MKSLTVKAIKTSAISFPIQTKVINNTVEQSTSFATDQVTEKTELIVVNILSTSPSEFERVADTTTTQVNLVPEGLPTKLVS